MDHCVMCGAPFVARDEDGLMTRCPDLPIERLPEEVYLMDLGPV